MGRHHPDKVAGAADEVRARAERRAREINAAYDRIRALRRAQA
jgi:curved DNA-binding protein CbpA